MSLRHIPSFHSSTVIQVVHATPRGMEKRRESYSNYQEPFEETWRPILGIVSLLVNAAGIWIPHQSRTTTPDLSQVKSHDAQLKNKQNNFDTHHGAQVLHPWRLSLGY